MLSLLGFMASVVLGGYSLNANNMPVFYQTTISCYGACTFSIANGSNGLAATVGHELILNGVSTKEIRDSDGDSYYRFQLNDVKLTSYLYDVDNGTRSVIHEVTANAPSYDNYFEFYRDSSDSTIIVLTNDVLGYSMGGYTMRTQFDLGDLRIIEDSYFVDCMYPSVADYYESNVTSINEVFDTDNLVQQFDYGFAAMGSGYGIGFSDGYSKGNKDGTAAGYADGYNVGFAEASAVDNASLTVFNGILNVGMLPINIFLAMLNFDVLGINISSLVMSALTIAMTVVVIGIFTGGNTKKKE